MTKKRFDYVCHFGSSVILSAFVILVSSFLPFALIRVFRGQNFLFVEIARWPRRGFQERVLHILLVKRFDWYRAPDLDRFLVLRLDWDRFADLGGGLCRFITPL